MTVRAKISTRSVNVVCKLDKDVRRFNVRGSMQRWHDVAADSLDGHFYRHELSDLVKRRMLDMVFYNKSETNVYERGAHSLCGTGWSVNITPKMIKTFWPERYTS